MYRPPATQPAPSPRKRTRQRSRSRSQERKRQAGGDGGPTAATSSVPGVSKQGKGGRRRSERIKSRQAPVVDDRGDFQFASTLPPAAPIPPAPTSATPQSRSHHSSDQSGMYTPILTTECQHHSDGESRPEMALGKVEDQKHDVCPKGPPTKARSTLNKSLGMGVGVPWPCTFGTASHPQ